MKRLKILLHGNCFDGAASAGLFARFYNERIDPEAEIVYSQKGHRRGRVFDDSDFDADDHAIVDFRYSDDARLGWWFDHHASAFQPKNDEAHFLERPTDHFFFDPSARSCTRFLVDSLERTYGWDASSHTELIGWAHIIDGAQFDSAAQATALAEPALQLMTFVEHNQDPVLARRFIDELTRASLADLAAERWVQRTFEPVKARQRHAQEIVRARIQTEHDVAFFDVGDDDLHGYNKFLPYLLAPEAKYVVAVMAREDEVKVSVGSNPWNKPKPLVHLARICERYGGGGHAVVGAITLPGGTLGEARRIAGEIVDELRTSTTKPFVRLDPEER